MGLVLCGFVGLSSPAVGRQGRKRSSARGAETRIAGKRAPAYRTRIGDGLGFEGFVFLGDAVDLFFDAGYLDVTCRHIGENSLAASRQRRIRRHRLIQALPQFGRKIGASCAAPRPA